MGFPRLENVRFLTCSTHSIGAGSRLLGLKYRTEDGPTTHGLSVCYSLPGALAFVLIRCVAVNPRSLYLVLRVRDLSDIFYSPFTLCYSDDFDCGDWLLFEVR